MKRALFALLLAACLQRNNTVVGENDGAADGGTAGGEAGGSAGAAGATAGGQTAGGSAAGAGGTTAGGAAGGAAGGTSASCGDIDVAPPSLDFGQLPFFSASMTGVTRRVAVRNVGCAPAPPNPALNLHLLRWNVRAKNASSPLDAICVGAFDEQTRTCLNALPASYDAVVGLAAVAGSNTLDLPIRVTAKAANQQLEWDVELISDDADEPMVTVNVRAQTVSLPPCQYTLTPASLSFGLLQDPAGRELSFVFRNLGVNAGEECLISWLDLEPGASAVFSLPGGPLSNLIVGPGQSLRVPVRAQPLPGSGAALQTHAGVISLFVSSPTGRVDVGLTAQTGQGCLYLSPAAVDFGDVTRACGSDLQRVSVFNLCAQAVSLPTSAVLPAPSELTLESAPAATLAPAAGTTLALRYRPADLGLDTATFQLRAVEGGNLVDYVVPLRGTGTTSTTRTESWTQDNHPKADVLLVLSNAPSMADDQAGIDGLRMNFSAFTRYAMSAGVDFKLGVLTPDLSAPDAGRLLGGPLSNITPNLEAVFAQRLQVGTDGGASTAVAEVVLRALTPPLSTTANAGLLRSGASLAVIAITDTPDRSPMPGAYYEARLRELKPGARISYNVIGPEWPASATCPADDPWPVDSTLRWLTLAFPGSHASICAAPSLSQLEQLGRDAFGFRLDFALTREVDTSMGPPVVMIDNNAGTGPVVLPTMTMAGATVWHFDAPTHAIVFEPLFTPDPGATLLVTYTPVCH